MRTITVALLFVAGLAVGTSAQASSSVAISSSPAGQVRVTIGTFIFEQGQKLTLEITREDPCPCLCDELLVTGFQVLHADGAAVYADETGAYPISAGDWTGRWDLVNGEGASVPEGKYTALVETSLGEFRAEIQVVPPGAAPLGGRSTAKASVCGIGLSIYRLVDEADKDGRVTLRLGERLMVTLSGNPTTGYGWEVEDEPATLARVEGVAYRPGSTLIGAGGTFYFRYEATKTGEGQLTFAYRRPWEALPPEQTFAITVIVRQ